MFLTYLSTVFLGIAVFLQFAVDQAPDLEDSHDNKAARRVLIAGLLLLFFWMGYRCYSGYSGEALPLFAMTMIALAEIAFCINRLFPDFGSAIVRTPLLQRNRVGRETWQ